MLLLLALHLYELDDINFCSLYDGKTVVQPYSTQQDAYQQQFWPPSVNA